MLRAVKVDEFQQAVGVFMTTGLALLMMILVAFFNKHFIAAYLERTTYVIRYKCCSKGGKDEEGSDEEPDIQEPTTNERHPLDKEHEKRRSPKSKKNKKKSAIL